MLKLLGSILIIGASASLGLAMRQQAAVRVRVLTEWIDCINLLILEIGGQSVPLQEAFHAIVQSRNKMVAPFFLEITKRLSGLPEYDFHIVWRDSMTRYIDGWGLSADEREILIGIADYLGRYDGIAQTKNLQTSMQRLTELRDAAALDLRSKSSLYRTCGTAVGILLVLVFI